jgi:hypothetical protein
MRWRGAVGEQRPRTRMLSSGAASDVAAAGNFPARQAVVPGKQGYSQ